MTKEEKTSFSIGIQQLAFDKKISFIDAVILYCEETELEIEIAAELIDECLKEKIEQEAKSLRYLPKSSELQL
jgi:hypothetical protein